MTEMKSGSYFEDPTIDRTTYECAAQNVYAAPGYMVVLEGWTNTKRQRLFIDPDHIDEVCRRLHQAKRVSRRAHSQRVR
jgi:hypothetical protein